MKIHVYTIIDRPQPVANGYLKIERTHCKTQVSANFDGLKQRQRYL